jgi:hypothetical protein
VFKSFVAWLDSYISQEEPASVLKALVGLMAFSGLLGTVFGNQAIRVGAFVVVIVFVVSVILLLLADRRRLRREYDVHRELIGRYCNFVIDNHPKPLISVEEWNEVVHIQANGDVKETLTLRAIALGKEVYFIRLVAGSGWDQPERYRRGVRLTARRMLVNGFSGPQWNVTRVWMSSSKMNAILHLHEPLRYGEEVRFEVKRYWPAKCQPLMRLGLAESFTCRTNDLLRIQNMEYTIVLPPGSDAVYEPIGFSEPDADNAIEVSQDKESRRVFTCRLANLPAHKDVGVRLELK